MNEVLKNRIVGVIILIALAAIIIPMLFEGSGQKTLKFKEIKEQKNIIFKYSEEVEEVNQEKSKKIDKINKNPNSKIINYKDLDNKKKTESNSTKWLIRVGSFSKKSNAQNQLKSLEKIYKQSFIIKSKKDNKNYYSVNIGPFFSIEDVKKNYSKIIKNKNFSESYILEQNLNNQ